MAVGIVYAGWLSGNETTTLAGAITLALGKHSNLGTVCFSLGFTLMLALDVALG